VSPHARLPLATFRFLAQYFRFETQGFDLLATAEPSLIVGYHGGPWTYDLWMLGTRMHDELGYFPRACWHRAWWRVPGVRDVVAELGGLPGPPTAADVRTIVARGQHLVLAPGGTREGLRPFWRTHAVDFGARRGYLRLAFAHGLPIVPVVATGLEATFVGLNDGHAFAKRMFGRDDVPAWVALGLGGVWPLALPFPVKIRQRIGAPIRLGEGVPSTDELEAAHARVTGTMQSMLDDLRRNGA
jgi:1-acyl-sn-glycerol-3-phosphate acyltransferase